jgi:phosphoribosylformylglycinamidine synthase
VLEAATIPDPVGLGPALLRLVACPDLCSRRWIWDQYDSMVGGQTAKRPGAADAAVVRVEESTAQGGTRALAMTTDCTPRYCLADPEEGGRQAVAEAWRNITAVGGLPLAITDNMNFGNPEKPEIMGQFAAAVRGMATACIALDFPVVSGNVSLYNETEGRAILPTPAIGGVGVLEDVAQAVGLGLPAEQALVLVGETAGWLGQSLWLREIAGREEGAPPPVDLAAERRNGDFVRAQIRQGKVAACHDASDGGLLVALAEMAMASGIGARLADAPAGLPPHAFWFGEDQGRFLLAVADAAPLLAAAAAAGVPAREIGRSGGGDLVLPGGVSISVAALRDAHEATLPAMMDGRA